MKFVATVKSVTKTGFHVAFHVEEEAGTPASATKTIVSPDGEATAAVAEYAEDGDILIYIEGFMEETEGQDRDAKEAEALKELCLSHRPELGQWALSSLYSLWALLQRYAEDGENAFFQVEEVWYVDNDGHRWEVDLVE